MNDNTTEKKTCFVVQGYGEKTDFTNGRKLNLDASYLVIKEAVEDAGMRCVRADELVPTGIIDIPMYEWIIKADLVIADLSTYNVNAAYELGVRYGVSPRATIIVHEDQFKNPFDFSHIKMYAYKHLGEDVGLAEARRFKKALTALIHTVMAAQDPDSPVYELIALDPPALRAARAAVARGAAPVTPAAEAAPPETGAVEASAKAMQDSARDNMSKGQFIAARELLKLVHTMRPNDQTVIQQLALATYKSKDPDARTALKNARDVISEKLNPTTTNDPETLGQWGAIHKRMWDLDKQEADLNAAIAGYERGFYLKQDYYNGINVAFLLNVRAREHQTAGRLADAIADFVLARRVRAEVTGYCEQALAAGPRTPDDKYWILATLWEAAVGLEDVAGVTKWQSQAEQAAAAGWMVDSTKTQLKTLEEMLSASPLKQLSLS
jgi:hypothetical protein